jgi:hypothetical protein
MSLARLEPLSRFSPPHNSITQKRMEFTCHQGCAVAYQLEERFDKKNKKE